MIKPVECFNIRVYKTANRQMEHDIQYPVKTIRCDKHNFSEMPVRIVADPFLFTFNNRVYLFYEQQRLYHPGTIMMTCSENLKEWTEPVTVLKEKCHLSFPFVFQDNGEVYMIPETSALGEIRLYRAADDGLKKFVYIKSIDVPCADDGKVNFADTCILKERDIYYLFTSTENSNEYQQHLYYADCLEGPYHKHPCSPIVRGNKVGRNGGSILLIDDMLVRVAQDCVREYGENIHLLKIDELTKETYAEHIIKENLLPTADGFYQNGGHQFNMVDFNGMTIISTDAKEYNYYFAEKILHKIGILR